MNRTIRILIAEEDPEEVSSGGECFKKLQDEKFDILLLDYSLPDGKGLDWLQRFNQSGIGVLTIFVKPKGDPKLSIEVMKEGVFDYINRSAECAKAFSFVVHRAVEGYTLMVEKVRLQKELIETKNFLESIVEKAGDAISVHGYTGFVLAVVPGKHLWNTTLMPFLFLISAMVSGYVLVILASIAKGKYLSNSQWLKERYPHPLKLFNHYFPTIEKEVISDLTKHLVEFIILDLFLIFCDVIVMLVSTEESYHTVMSLLTGRFAPLFLGLEMSLGALVPLFILSYRRTKAVQTWQVFASILVLVGIMTVRYIVNIGGQSFPVQLI